jgi:hypothetical protein
VPAIGAFDWSADGRYVTIMRSGAGTGDDTYLLPMSGDTTPIPFLVSKHHEGEHRFSRDGKWMVYTSEESGTAEVYVQTVPASDRRLRISTAGGMQPMWSGDGREIFYLALDGKLMAADVRLAPELAAGVPRPLFQTNADIMYVRNSYSPARDGRRFLVSSYVDTDAPTTAVIVNWPAALPHAIASHPGGSARHGYLRLPAGVPPFPHPRGSMHHRPSFLALALAMAAAPTIGAQTAPAPNPYKVLYITREVVKPGKGGAHDKLESEWARSLAASKTPVHALAMSAVTGPRETWFVSGFPSHDDAARLQKAFAAIPALEQVSTRLDPREAELVAESRGMVLQLREDLSYRAVPNLPQMRYFSINRTSVRPGHLAEFVEARKAVKQAHETAKVPDYYTVYQAVAGAPTGTFYIFIPMKSLVELDDVSKIHGTAEYTAALGGEEGRKKFDASVSNYLIGSQTDLFAFSPGQSIVSAAWAKQDPTYWKLQTTAVAP